MKANAFQELASHNGGSPAPSGFAANGTALLALGLLVETFAAVSHAARASAIYTLLSPNGGGDPNGKLGLRALAGQAEDEEKADVPGRAVFRWNGEYWTVAYEGQRARLRDSKGLHYIARLIANPNAEISSVALSGGPDHDPGPLDDRAKAAYRRQLAELRGELEEAEAFNDPERIVVAKMEMESLTSELARAAGLCGGDHGANCPAERARVNVTRAIKQALNRIAAENEPLGTHLKRAIKTGSKCCYLPGPGSRVSWLR